MVGFYGDDVEADGSIVGKTPAGEHRAGAADEAPLLANVDRLLGCSEPAGGARPHLDETEDLSVEGQEVDLSVAQVQVPGYDPVPLLAQVFLCDGLPVTPPRAGAPLAGPTVHRRPLPERGDGS